MLCLSSQLVVPPCACLCSSARQGQLGIQGTKKSLQNQTHQDAMQGAALDGMI